MCAMTLKSGKELKEPRKNREVKHETELNKPKPKEDQDTTSNAKEVGDGKKEPY